MLALPDVSLTLRTDRGVFSGDRVDPGTKLLLLEAPVVGDRLCDLGCGYGPIAVTLAVRAPAATVWAVDVNQRALALTAVNAERAGATNVVTGEPPGPVTALYSNPPIRIGKEALHRLLGQWVPRADVSFLVVHKHLGSDSLAGWMGDRGWVVDRLVSRAGYRLLRVTP